MEQNRPGIKGVRKTASKKKSLVEQIEVYEPTRVHDVEAVSWIKFRSPCQADADGSLTESRPAPIKRNRSKKNENANNCHADGRPIIETKTTSKRRKDNLEKDTNAVEPPTKKSKSAPKKTTNAQVGDAESEPKSDKDPPKGNKADFEKTGRLIGRKELYSEHVVASPPGLSSRRPQRKRAVVSRIGPEANETDPESNVSENGRFVSERKAQRRRKKAGGDVRK